MPRFNQPLPSPPKSINQSINQSLTHNASQFVFAAQHQQGHSTTLAEPCHHNAITGHACSNLCLNQTLNVPVQGTAWEGGLGEEGIKEGGYQD